MFPTHQIQHSRNLNFQDWCVVSSEHVQREPRRQRRPSGGRLRASRGHGHVQRQVSSRRDQRCGSRHFEVDIDTEWRIRYKGFRIMTG